MPTAGSRIRPRVFCSGLVALALTSGLIAAVQNAPSAHGRLSETAIDAAQIDEFLARTTSEWNEGCHLLLIQGDRILYERSFGRFDPRKPLRIASATKWLTGAVVLALVDEGKLDLDEAIVRYLPKFSGDKSRITVRQLLGHMSGLPMADPALERRDISLEQSVDAISGVPLMSAPGQVCLYGDVSVQVAGRIAEIASGLTEPSGQAWKSLFQSKLSVPLEMAATSCEGARPTRNPHLAGGATSTPSDYATFLVMLLKGGEFRGRRVLSQAAVAEMFRDQTHGAPLRFNPFQQFPELCPGWRQVRYGLCNWLEAIDVTGKTLEASAPGLFGFCPWIDFSRNLAGVFASEAGMSKAFPAYLKLKGLIARSS